MNRAKSSKFSYQFLLVDLYLALYSFFRFAFYVYARLSKPEVTKNRTITMNRFNLICEISGDTGRA